jgi:polyhydroxybutyrate depolymerase
MLLPGCGSTNEGDGSLVRTDMDAGHGARELDSALTADGRSVANMDGSGSDTGASCGTRTGMRGLTSRSLTVDGLARTYRIYLPASANPSVPMPFVFVFHGYTMSGQEMYDLTAYAALADSEGIALAFPDGQGGPDSLSYPWNIENPGQVVCGYGQGVTATGNDFAFMDAMEADVSRDQCLDAAHIFSTGLSMGGYFTEHVGCYRSDIRAVAPHSGGTLASLAPCTTGHVPIILFHGTGDPVIDDACDDPTVTPDVGFTAAATLWAAKNGCQATYTTVQEPGATGGTGQCYLYDGCPADGQVELCTFNGMGHCWAGGVSAGSGDNACPSYASATDLEWTFFKKYAW